MLHRALIAASSIAIASIAHAIAIPSIAHAQTPRVAIDYQRFQLANGLDVVLQRLAHVPAVTVMTTYRVGSANEPEGRSGFAHLFEHLMFKGSRHVPAGQFADRLVDAGGGANATTSRDRTLYASFATSEATELALYLEAERMAFLRDGLTQQVLDIERDVVKNERRERIDNRRYGDAFILLAEAMYGEGHPYRRPALGSMQDLSAATLDDVLEFHRTYYVPNNAILVVVGDIDLAATRRWVEKWYGSLPRGAEPPAVMAPIGRTAGDVRLIKEDDVQLPRLYLGWRTPPAYVPGSAAMEVVAELLGGSGGRLRRRLVDQRQIAQDVTVFQETHALGSDFYVQATARPGQDLDALASAIDEELRLLRSEPPDADAVRRVVGSIELSLASGIQSTGGSADRLSAYLQHTGLPGFFAQDLARYRALSPRDLSDAAIAFLPLERRAALSIVPRGHPELALDGSRPAGSPR